MKPLLIDYNWSAVGLATSSGSLLALPAGAGTILDHLLYCIGHEPGSPFHVMPTFSPGDDYRAAMDAASSSSATVLEPEDLSRGLAEHEACDQLVVVDPIYWPIGDWRLSAHLVPKDGFRGATHFVALGTDIDRTMERIDRDNQGRVKRVERVYRRMSWPDAATNVFLSIVPSRAVGSTLFRSASELRQKLSLRGVVSRDIALPVDVIGLAAEAGLLALNERLIVDELHARGRRDGERESNGHGHGNGSSSLMHRGNGTLIGRRCEVHSTVRFVGPVIIQDGVTLERGVSIVGPAVLGAGAYVAQDATIVQSVLAGKTRAPASATILHRVLAGDIDAEADLESSRRVDAGAVQEPFTVLAHCDGPIEASQDKLASRRRVQLVLKRLVDLVFSTLALVVLSPVLLVVALLVKWDSRGPIFFAHRREQKEGKEFSCWKFRTMVSDAHQLQRELYQKNEVDGPQFKLSNDPRITRLGHILRVTNIDELPQLINVWLGHMSMVGPRPSPFRENQICVPWRRARLSVPPGITGLWQLCRHNRSGGDFHQWIYYDMLYIRHFSTWLDIKILLATVLTLAGRWSIPVLWLVKAPDSVPETPMKLAAPAV